LIRALGVEKCPVCALVWLALRSCSHAAIFLDEGFVCRDNPAIEALGRQDAEFRTPPDQAQLPCLWSVVPFEAFGTSRLAFGGRKMLRRVMALLWMLRLSWTRTMVLALEKWDIGQVFSRRERSPTAGYGDR